MQYQVDVVGRGERLADVVPDEGERGIVPEVGDVAAVAGAQVVDAGHAGAGGQQALAQVRSQEARTAGDDVRGAQWRWWALTAPFRTGMAR